MGSVLKFQGLGTALLTPFHRDGSVDYDAYAACVERQVRGGADFLVPLATTGETPTLSSEEKVKLLGITREKAGSRPLLVGAGSNSVPGTLANMQLLEGLGADAWLVVVPFYNKPTQEGQYRYFCEIASRSALPIVIYNVPGRTGANMTAETCLRIAKACPNVIGTKEASGKIEQVASILEGLKADPELAARFSVLSGDDDMTLDMVKLGADGVISVASNVDPGKVSAMVHAALKGRACGSWAEAEGIDASLAGLYKACFVESNPIPAKYALSRLGLTSDVMRLPLVSASASTRAAMDEVLSSLGLI